MSANFNKTPENSAKKSEYKEISLAKPQNKLTMNKACCSQKSSKASLTELSIGSKSPKNAYIIYISVALLTYLLVYLYAAAAVNWLIYDFLGQNQNATFPKVAAHFINNLADIFILLVLIVYAVAWFRAGLQVENIRNYLVGKKRILGYIIAVLFGAITPFCSCSSVPIFVAFSVSGIPLGITMAFLITSPMVNEVAVFLLWGVVGWQLTVVYVAMGLSFGILGGYIMDAIGAERWVKLLPELSASGCCAKTNKPQANPSLNQRHNFALIEVKSTIKIVWLWLVIGIAVGATLYGYVPSSWFAENLGAGQWWSVPVAVLAGIPLYANVIAIVPILDSLLQKGVPFGTTLAFSMSIVAISMPEIIMLKQVMRWQLLLIFVCLMFTFFILGGWFFDYIEILLS